MSHAMGKQLKAVNRPYPPLYRQLDKEIDNHLTKQKSN